MVGSQPSMILHPHTRSRGLVCNKTSLSESGTRSISTSPSLGDVSTIRPFSPGTLAAIWERSLRPLLYMGGGGKLIRMWL